jgi:hypothetical protein
MLWGAATGLASASLFGNGPVALLDNGAAFAAFSLAGAICGFIYWRIGVRGVPAAPPRLDPVL